MGGVARRTADWVSRLGSRRRVGAPDSEGEIERLKARIDRLESVVEGLQDALHRQSVRQEESVSELERKTKPEAMTRSLAKHARERGIE